MTLKIETPQQQPCEDLANTCKVPLTALNDSLRSGEPAMNGGHVERGLPIFTLLSERERVRESEREREREGEQERERERETCLFI